MENSTLCEEAIKKHYRSIFLYCFSLLNGDEAAAEDCTQDVFLLLVRKTNQNELDYSKNIRGWLYAAAQRICRDYLKRQTKQKEAVPFSLDEIKELPAPDEDNEADLVFDALTEDEYQLLTTYYTEQYGKRMQLARSLELTPAQLSKKISAIRKKLKKQT